VTPYVVSITTAPVKGLGLAHAAEVVLEQSGALGNRRFYLVDETGRLVNGKAAGTLVQVTAHVDDGGTTCMLQFPDGFRVDGDVELGDAVVTSFYRRMVHGRLVEGPWAEALSAFAGRPLRLVRAEEPGSASDRGAKGGVSLISAASLARLAEEAGGGEPVDARRFRMLFQIDGATAHEEDGWIGREVQAGEAVVRFNGRVGRCAVTTQNPDTGVPDLDTLRVLRSYRWDVATDEPLPFGIWGGVVVPGRVRVGDPVVPIGEEGCERDLR